MKVRELIKRIKLPARASMYYLAASAVGKLVSFVITPFATRLLSEEDFGQFSLYMAILGASSILSSSITSGSAIYKGLKDHDGSREGYLRVVLGINMAFSLSICLLLLAFMPFLKLKSFLLIPMTLQILCDGIIAIAMSEKRFDYKYKTVTAVAVTSAVLPPSMAIFILKRWGGGYVVRIYALLFVSLCLAFYSLRKIIKRRKTRERGTARYVIRTSAALLPHSISGALSIQADKLFITAIMGSAALAKYSVVYSLGIGLQFTVSAIGSALTPWIIRRLDLGEARSVSNLMLPMVIGYSALSLCLVAIAPEAMLILAPREYLDALPAILPIALSTPLYFISSVATVGISYSGKGRYAVITSLVSTTLCIILNYTLIGRFGYAGAGAVTLVCQAVSVALEIYFLSKVGLSDMLPTGSIPIFAVVGCGIGLMIYALRESVMARLLILLLPIAMLLYCLKRAGELVLEKGGKISP